MRDILLIGEQTCDPKDCKIKPLVEHENNMDCRIIVAANGDTVLQTIDQCHERIQAVIIDSRIRINRPTPYQYGTTRPESGKHVIAARIRTTSIPNFAIFQTSVSSTDISDDLANVEILSTHEDLQAFLKCVAKNSDILLQAMS
ncbi:MAG: hypothetical protein AAB739_01765 [Patescibacteria group bacterium]